LLIISIGPLASLAASIAAVGSICSLEALIFAIKLCAKAKEDVFFRAIEFFIVDF
jgi:hypothetical protein